MAITRVLYIVYPMKAKSWFGTKTRRLVVSLIPATIGALYAFPSLHSCCYRFYVFPMYAMSYMGPNKKVSHWKGMKQR